MSFDPTMLAGGVVQRAYELDAAALDGFAHQHGAADWFSLTECLEYLEEDTGGGFACLSAELPGGHVLMITDGEAGLPTGTDRFWLGILNDQSEEVLTVQS